VAEHAGFRRDAFESIDAVAKLCQRGGFERYLRVRKRPEARSKVAVAI
jgi:hypothetical protein